MPLYHMKRTYRNTHFYSIFHFVSVVKNALVSLRAKFQRYSDCIFFLKAFRLHDSPTFEGKITERRHFCENSK